MFICADSPAQSLEALAFADMEKRGKGGGGECVPMCSRTLAAGLRFHKGKCGKFGWIGMRTSRCFSRERVLSPS